MIVRSFAGISRDYTTFIAASDLRTRLFGFQFRTRSSVLLTFRRTGAPTTGVAFDIFDALPPHTVAAAYSGPINTTAHNGTALSMLHSTLGGWQRQRLCWNVSGAFGSRRGDNANRRVLQPRCYSRVHTRAEYLVPLDVSGLTILYV
jgi:hypothetical protein